jgi:hypothetical protein
MGERCQNCEHMDVEGTELPVCKLHRRFMSPEWTCGDFERRGDGEEG